MAKELNKNIYILNKYILINSTTQNTSEQLKLHLNFQIPSLLDFVIFLCQTKDQPKSC